MEISVVKLTDLVKPEKNVRIHTEQQIKEFRRSVNMFGQIRPIVIDENNVILAGNGLYDTLVAMGMETVDVYRVENLTENQKKKLMIADNKIFNLGIENLDTFNSFLEELQGDLDIPGYDEDILKQMVSDAEDVTEKLSEYGTLDEDEIRAIKKKSVERTAMLKTESNDNESQELNNSISITQSEIIKQEQDKETAEIKKFVLCPKCGEKIWL